LELFLHQPSAALTKLKKELLSSGLERDVAPVDKVRPLGFNCAMRAKQKRIDDYLGDMDDNMHTIANHLVSLGADINFRDCDSNSPLLLAVQLKGSERFVKTALHTGNVDITPFLITTGKRVSLLDHALRVRNRTIVELLLNAGCLPTSDSLSIRLLDFARLQNRALLQLSVSRLQAALYDGPSS
jgi:ankyrin repeat protein